jgi:hypothetical protein
MYCTSSSCMAIHEFQFSCSQTVIQLVCFKDSVVQKKKKKKKKKISVFQWKYTSWCIRDFYYLVYKQYLANSTLVVQYTKQYTLVCLIPVVELFLALWCVWFQLLCLIPVVELFLALWFWLRTVPLIRSRNRDHGGCDRSTGNTFSMHLILPTSGKLRGSFKSQDFAKFVWTMMK